MRATCPVCSAELPVRERCPRCRTDLSLLVHLEDLPRNLVEEGVRLGREGMGAEAAERLQVAAALAPGDRDLCLKVARELARAGFDGWALLHLRRLEQSAELAPEEKEVVRILGRRERIRRLLERVLGTFFMPRLPRAFAGEGGDER